MNRIATAAITLVAFLGLSAASGQSWVWSGGVRGRPAPLPPLRDGLSVLRFSPDGRYILAQGRSWVTVLTVQPFKVLFRAPAEYAVNSAHFTPDSRQVLFVTSALHEGAGPLVVKLAPHLERWSIADRCRSEAVEMFWWGFRDYSSAGLSPDGLVCACVDTRGTLRLISVPSGETIFEKKKLGKTWIEVDLDGDSKDQGTNPELGDPGSARFHFSRDGRFVIAVPHFARGSAIAFDLRERRALGLRGKLRELRGTCDGIVESAFVAPDEVIMSKVSYHKATSMLVAFPSGRVLSRSTLPPGPLSGMADPGFVRIHPLGPFDYGHHDPIATHAVAVELSTGHVIVSDTPGLDVFGNHYVIERDVGELGLYERGKGLQSTVKLDPH